MPSCRRTFIIVLPLLTLAACRNKVTASSPADSVRQADVAVKNAYGRWTATPAQQDSVVFRTGFADSLRFVVPGCPPHAPIDSLVYGTIEFSEETGDASGEQFVFRRHGTWMSGVALEAAGGIPAPISLRGLRNSGNPGALTFWFSTGGRDIYYWDVTLTCDSLGGTARNRVIADARYDDVGGLGQPRSVVMRRAKTAVTAFPK